MAAARRQRAARRTAVVLEQRRSARRAGAGARRDRCRWQRCLKQRRVLTTDEMKPRGSRRTALPEHYSAFNAAAVSMAAARRAGSHPDMTATATRQTAATVIEIGSAAIWGHVPEMRPSTLDVHIRGLRRKLGVYADQYVETVVGTGYRFRPPFQPGVKVPAFSQRLQRSVPERASKAQNMLRGCTSDWRDLCAASPAAACARYQTGKVRNLTLRARHPRGTQTIGFQSDGQAR